jgi:transposase
MWSAAASAILEGMPEAADLRVLRSDGQTWIFAGKTALFRFADGDSGLRNVAVAALRQIGFSGRQVAAALGLTTNYVATLHQRAQREGTAGLVRPRGRPRLVTGQDWEQARAWRAAGVRDAEIARRLGVQQSTVLRRLGPARVQGELEEAADPGPAAAGGEETAEDQEEEESRSEPEAVLQQDTAGAGGRAGARRAGAREPAWARAGAGAGRRSSGIRGNAAGCGRRAGVLPVCRGDAAARLPRAGRGHPAGSGRPRGAGDCAAVDGERVLRARRRHGRTVQAPGPGRGRAAGRAGRAAVAADAAAPAGRGRRRR